MSIPKRIQLSRAKGWRIPLNTVKIDRSTRWGNPYVVGSAAAPTAEDAVRHFEESITPEYRALVKANLRGKDLACWCAVDSPWCHGDPLLRIANE